MTADLNSEPVALVVIDMQEGMFDGLVFPPIHDAEGLEARCQRIMVWARRTQKPIAFIRHDAPSGQALAPGAPGWAIRFTLECQADEPVFSKTLGDALSQPALGQWIEDLGVRRVILLGAQTDQCVAATLAGALDRGLGVTVISDGHSTWASNGETASEIIARYNQAFAVSGATVASTEALIAEA